MIGDADDYLVRLADALPDGWFEDAPRVLDATLSGPAQIGAIVHGQRTYASKQMRVRTASGGYLDLIARDFYGNQLTRRPGQSDGSFRSQIIARLFRQGVTRSGMIKLLTDLTGYEPSIFEPASIQDAGAYGFTLAYGTAGGWGSLSMPMTAFISVRRPASNVAANVGGYNTPMLAYGVAGRYIGPEELIANTTDADILSAIDRARPIGSTIYVSIRN